MQFGLTETQQVLKSAAREFFSAECPIGEVRRLMDTGTAYDAALRSYRQGVGTYTDLATEENAVVQGDTQVEDARANAHTAAAALALSMGAIDIAGAGLNP